MKTRLAVTCAVILPLFFLWGDPRATPVWGTFLIALVGFGLGRVADLMLFGRGEKRHSAHPALVAATILGALALSSGAALLVAQARQPQASRPPPPRAKPETSVDVFVVTVRADGGLEMAGARFTDAELTAELAKHPREERFILKTSDGVPYPRLVEVLDLFARSGHASVSVQ
jgi:biopolymer transport protein ExbD